MADNDLVTEIGLKGALDSVAGALGSLVSPSEGLLWSDLPFISTLAEDDELLVKDVSEGTFHRITVADLRTVLAV